MIISKKALPRRTFLRGVGTALALPLVIVSVALVKGVPVTMTVRDVPAQLARIARHRRHAASAAPA